MIVDNNACNDKCYYQLDLSSLTNLKVFEVGDYSVCEIENMNRLEVIEMGKLNEESFNFWYASLKLKSDYDGMK